MFNSFLFFFMGLNIWCEFGESLHLFLYSLRFSIILFQACLWTPVVVPLHTPFWLLREIHKSHTKCDRARNTCFAKKRFCLWWSKIMLRQVLRTKFIGRFTHQLLITHHPPVTIKNLRSQKWQFGSLKLKFKKHFLTRAGIKQYENQIGTGDKIFLGLEKVEKKLCFWNQKYFSRGRYKTERDQSETPLGTLKDPPPGDKKF